MDLFERLDYPMIYHIMSYMNIKEKYAMGSTCWFLYEFYANDKFVIAAKTWRKNVIPFFRSISLFSEFKRITGIDKNIDALKYLIGGNISNKESIIIAMVYDCKYMDLFEMPLEYKCVVYLRDGNLDKFWEIFKECNILEFTYIINSCELHHLLNKDIIQNLYERISNYSTMEKISIRTMILIYQMLRLKEKVYKYNESNSNE